ncbi:nucleoside phosphorylase domain-containing protein [Trichoderma camerunense]
MDSNSSRSRKRTRPNDNDGVSLAQAFKRPRIEESPVKLQNESYTIAWICALPIEMAAANAMLDGVHPSLPSNAKDSNSYILGNIGRHNIVVACLPADHYGTNSAAVVANNLIRTFPSIRNGLMVGIGGGVPGSVDMRLGDIVVGYNVIQHDLGKMIQGSRVCRTGTPKSPPSSLLAAVSKLRAIHESRPSRVPSFLQEMIMKHPKMTRYTYPWSSQDRLFRATYSHSLGLATCDSCDTSMLIYRPLRMDNHPVIHYGNVASGNQVMKDAISRDEIAQELNVICFEMEAAGIVDTLPCLVIRGICDYSDSHKNKQWQEYAAATAAAYVKELLIEAVPEPVVEPRLKSSDSYSAELETALAPWQVSSSQWTIPQLQQSIPILFQQQLCQQLPLSPVLVIDSRGCYLPFYLETIDSKELFVEILRHRFKDLGTNKIERGEWTLEYQQNGQCLDLSKDWQSVIKPNQILNMRMIFRRQNHSSTKCPSCGFMNPGLQSDEVQCRRCSLNFRRIEEIQDIRISSDSSNAQTDLVEVSAARFQRPRPPKPQNPEEDICRYKQVQLVDVDFKIGLSTVDQLVMKTALKLNSGDLSDIEYLAERLALAYGLSEADSLALSQKIDVQHAHIRSLQRHLLDSDSVSGSKGKQTAEVDQLYDTISIVGQRRSSPDPHQGAVLYTPTTLHEVDQGFDASYASEVADFVLFPTTVDKRFQPLFTEMPGASFDFSETTQPDIFQPIGWSDVDI